MKNIIDFEKVLKVFIGFGDQITDRLKDAVESKGLARLDESTRELFLEFGDVILQEMFQRIGESIRFSDESSPKCEHCGKPLKFKQMRKMPFRSSLTGKSRDIKFPMMVCENCHKGMLWMREVLDLDRDGFTQRLREMSVAAGAMEPFEGASEEIMKGLVGVEVSGSKIHTLCQDAGKVAEELMEAGALGESRPVLPGEKLYVEADGGMMHIDGDWHEAKLAIAFPQSSLGEITKDRGAITQRQAVSTLDDREELGEKLFKMVEKYLPKTPDGAPIIAGNVVVLGDGAKWIFNMMEEHLPGASFLLDWYHMDEHIAEAARVMFPEDEATRKRWCSRKKNLLRKGRIDEMVESLQRKSMSLKAGSKEQEAVAELYKYLNERRGCLKYREARNEGLIIGSGAVESAISHVFQQRMKRSGMRWRHDGAEAMCALRCAYRSNKGLDAVFSRMNKQVA